MRDRLIELITKATTEVTFRTSGGRPVTKIQRSIVDRAEAKDLADHLIANGVILPPCKVGDMVYLITDCTGDMRRTVTGFTQDKILSYGMEISMSKLGKTVFLTKEEAEKALKEKEI